MPTKEYLDYMKSDAWEQKKQERISIDNGCAMCGRPLNKIHNYYNRKRDKESSSSQTGNIIKRIF